MAGQASKQQKLDVQLKGLYLSPNNLSSVPEGALEVADNVVIDRINIVESRRGQTQYGSPLSIGSAQINKLFNYTRSLIANYDDKMAYDSGNGAWVDYVGTYVAPSADSKMRSLEAMKNFYFTTSNGIYKLDQLAATPRPAGVVEALSGTYSLTGSSGFLVADSAVAYRLVWSYTDANNNLYRGAPSQRLIASNAGPGDFDVQLTYLIPDSITTDFTYQIYRSVGTATAADTPTDELQLVLQGKPTAGEITAKSFTITDTTPYSLMRQTIYTAPSQEGIENANYEPPLATDMDVYKNCAFYANVRQKQQVSVNLISVDSPSFGYVVDATVDTHTNFILDSITSTANLRVGMRAVGTGIQANSVIVSIDSATQVTLSKATTATATVSVEFQDRFSIGSDNFWGGTANDVATNTFLVEDSFTPADNIDETALNLIQIVNTSTSNTSVYAYYLSGIGDLPGQILFKARNLSKSQFYLTSTAGTSFSPNLPAGNAISAISVDDPTEITSTAHGLTSGDSVVIFGSNSTPSVDGSHVVTVLDANTFTVDVDVTVAGNTGVFMRSDEAVLSESDSAQNRVYVSKTNQVESVPSYSFFNIGSSNFPIQRVVALRDGIFFFKQDGVYRLSGETFSSFSVSLVDNTVVLKAPESVVPLNNQIYCFTTQGICAITDSGVQIMSVPIENALLELSSEQYPYFASASFGVAYESSRQYMFFTVTQEGDQFATQAFVWNYLTKSWTRWVMDRTCGVVNTTINKLFMGQTDTGQVLIERKNYTNSDYADEQYAITITSVVSDTEYGVVSTANIVAGMSLVQNSKASLIESVDAMNSTITLVSDLYEYVAGAAIIYTPIMNRIQWAPIDAENPGILKQFSEFTLVFRNAAFTEIDASFRSSIIGTQQTVPLVNQSNQAGWGLFGWGELPWGGAPGGMAVLRTYVPRNYQRASWISIALQTQEAFTGFSLQGISVIYNPMNTWIK